MSRRRHRSNGPSRANLRSVGRKTEKPDEDQPVYSDRRPGRPTKLTPEVERRFLDCLKAGNYRTVCAAYSGLAPATVEKWIKRGRGTVADRPASPEYVRFVRLVEEAEATSEVLVVGNLVARSKQDHNAGLAWLNRSGSPERRARWRLDRDRDDDDEMPDGAPVPQLPSGAPPLALAPGSVNYDQRDQRQQVIVISQNDVPDVVSQLLARQREERAAQRQAQAAAMPPPEAPNDTRIARLDGLRSDASDIEDDEAD